MGFEYYYVVIAVVILKVLIWMCVLYFRAERLKRARAQRSFIVVDSHTGPGHSSAISSQHRQHNDQSAIIDFEEAPATSQGPPSYDQAMSNCEDKPPPYSQVVSEGLPEITTPAPPHFTPPSETNSPQREITQ